MLGRRRGFVDDGEDEEIDYDAKRRRKDANDVEDSLENLIIHVGEMSNTSLGTTLDGLANLLEAEIPSFGQRIINVFLKCAVDMPERLTIYSTLIGLLNSKNYSFGSEFIDSLVTDFRKCLKCDFEVAQIQLVFLCDLVNSHVVSAHSLISLLYNLVLVVSEKGSPQVRSDAYVYTVLSALPWVGLELSHKQSSELLQLLNAIEKYVEDRQRLHVPMLRVWSTNKPHPQEDIVDCLWKQIQKLVANGWQERFLLRPYIAFEAVLCEALQHDIAPFHPPAHEDSTNYPPHKVVFRMFDSTDCPEEGPVLPEAHSIERYLVEFELTWILKRYHLERKDCATALISYSKRSLFPLNYVILEVVFGQLFNLPQPPYLDVFYGSLLIELCKLEPNSMPQVLAQTAEMLYQQIDTMAPACFDKFVDWFAYHLSNFQFRWSWEDWTDCLELDPLSPKQLFVREVLYKCMRFSYHQRVLDIVPSSFSGLVPEKPLPYFKYAHEGAQNLPGTVVAQALAQAIRNKCNPGDIAFILNDCPYPCVEMGEESSFNPLKVDVLFLTLLNFGTKSFSHSFAALAKYHESLKELTDGNEEGQLTLLRCMYEMWRTHQQMMVVLTDKMLKMQIIECPAAVNWLFSKEMEQDFHRLYVWEIMVMTLTKMSRHINKMRTEIELAQRRLHEGLLTPEPNAVTEADIEQMQDALESAENEQKNLLLMVFQRFTILLTEHLLQSEAEGVDYNTYWYRWQYEEVSRCTETLENLLFTSDVDPHILEIFHQFCALKR